MPAAGTAVRPEATPKRADDVATIGGDPPASEILLPDEARYLGPEQRRFVEIEMPADPLAMLRSGAAGIFLLRDVVHFSEQRQIAIGPDVSLTPVGSVPGTAEITEFDDAVVDAFLRD